MLLSLSETLSIVAKYIIILHLSWIPLLGSS